MKERAKGQSQVKAALKTIDVDLRLMKHRNEFEYIRSVRLPYRENYLIKDDKPLLNFQFPKPSLHALIKSPNIRSNRRPSRKKKN